MGVYIQNMEMPTSCYNCPCADLEFYDCNLMPGTRIERENRLPNCPLVPVPPHGRLIDADALEVHDGWMNEDREKNVQQTHITFVFSNDIANAPTIISAEEGEA